MLWIEVSRFWGTSIHRMPTVADGSQPAWFARVHSATTSWTRFRVLELATQERLTAGRVARSLACDPKAAAHHLKGLHDEGLLRGALGPGFEITEEGEAIHTLLRNVDRHPASALVGWRLLGIKYDQFAARQEVRAVLTARADLVLRADGDLDLVAVFPDDPDLVADLEQAVREGVARTVRTRIA